LSFIYKLRLNLLLNQLVQTLTDKVESFESRGRE